MHFDLWDVQPQLAVKSCNDLAILDFNWKFFALRLAVKLRTINQRGWGARWFGAVWLNQKRFASDGHRNRRTSKKSSIMRGEDNLIKNCFRFRQLLFLLLTFSDERSLFGGTKIHRSGFLFYCFRAMKNDPNSFTAAVFMCDFSQERACEYWRK